MKITFLGTGTSFGVPAIGCKCEVCTSTDPHDRRLRSSAMFETDTTRVIIDCGPDFREQMLKQEFKKIDALLLTHNHYDHIGGIDDIRAFWPFGTTEVYGDHHTIDSLHHALPYLFKTELYPGVAHIHCNEISAGQELQVGDMHIRAVEVMHGKLPILAYRINDIGYITDMKTISDESAECFKGVKLLIVNGLRFKKEHHSHQTVEDAIAFSEKLGSPQTYLIHLNHDVGLHEEVNKILPPHVRLPYDGMTIDF